jgi:hypothetical protein
LVQSDTGGSAGGKPAEPRFRRWPTRREKSSKVPTATPPQATDASGPSARWPVDNGPVSKFAMNFMQTTYPSMDTIGVEAQKNNRAWRSPISFLDKKTVQEASLSVRPLRNRREQNTGWKPMQQYTGAWPAVGARNSRQEAFREIARLCGEQVMMTYHEW